MLTMFKEDVLRYISNEENNRGMTRWKIIRKVLSESSLWIIFLHRYGQWVYRDVRIPIIGVILKIFYIIQSNIVNLLYDTHIDLRAELGKGFYISHYGGIWIGPTRFGEKCNISHGVTIGLGGRGESRGIPRFGNGVYIGPGSAIFGNITIGNNVAIGANAVISKSIPDNAIVVGNPGRIVGYEGAREFVDPDQSDDRFFPSF